MCLILLAWNCHPEYRLVLAANRDEFHRRPTAPATWWSDPPEILAGRDLVGGGTWCGVDRRGRWAAVTNFRDFRDPDRHRSDAPSRGLLVRDFLSSGREPRDWIATQAPMAQDYHAFNLLAGNRDQVAWFSSRGGAATVLTPGIHGLSNALLNTPWPKVTSGKAALAKLVQENRVNPGSLFTLLADRTPAAAADLPDTGVGLAWERLLSSRFICSSDYGTRASTLLLITDSGAVEFFERSFTAGGVCQGEVQERFQIRP
ncbi:hypothetical protein DBW_3569 [Desulfuromonas sp. DDH964]|uniref:NRDE family protein n=1 Tax=Desulfuromonas sp. DDH964 TaxID=1823759 RepID=UPI00078EF729|nr:NRDE family protein [Desulfuromonas sp. DDH964]AMV73867.1 hypothetical protein DBW_3569 [Desulfuromonas sp. DDH964]